MLFNTFLIKFYCRSSPTVFLLKNIVFVFKAGWNGTFCLKDFKELNDSIFEYNFLFLELFRSAWNQFKQQQIKSETTLSYHTLKPNAI